MTIDQAINQLAQGLPVYKWSYYWQGWSEVLSIRLDEESGLYEFSERTIGGRVRHHRTQLGKGDCLSDCTN